MALRMIQKELFWCAQASPTYIPKNLRALRESVKDFILPKRKRPRFQGLSDNPNTATPLLLRNLSERH